MNERETMNERELLEGVERELRGVKEIELTLNAADAFVLISQLQLALRHPDNQGRSAIIARKIVERLRSVLAQGRPAVEEIIRRGYDPQHDVKVRHDGPHRS